MAVAVIMPRQGNTVESCIITRWNKKEHRTERYYTTERLSMAEAVFVLWCDNWGATDIIETEQTWNATDFD